MCSSLCGWLDVHHPPCWLSSLRKSIHHIGYNARCTNSLLTAALVVGFSGQPGQWNVRGNGVTVNLLYCIEFNGANKLNGKIRRWHLGQRIDVYVFLVLDVVNQEKRTFSRRNVELVSFTKIGCMKFFYKLHFEKNWCETFIFHPFQLAWNISFRSQSQVAG